MKIGTIIRSDVEDLYVQVDGERIEEVNEFKYLGVAIDNRLSFGPHVEYTVKRWQRRLVI